MTKTRKTTKNINDALADPTTVFGFQTDDKTRKAVNVRRTKTGRAVVTFDDGAVCRYTGAERVIVIIEVRTPAITPTADTDPRPARFRRTW